MKTISQILKEEGFTFDERGYADGLITESDFVRIGRIYAEQALDAAINIKQNVAIHDGFKYNIINAVKVENINFLKSLLK